jgi:hypothetical protein
MRLFHPGQLVLPLMLILTGTLLVMGQFNIIRIAQYEQLWPVTLIAAGLEELYRWSSSRDDR